MIPTILIIGGAATLFLLLNALLSFRQQGPTWASWFRLQVVIFPALLTQLALTIASMFS